MSNKKSVLTLTFSIIAFILIIIFLIVLFVKILPSNNEKYIMSEEETVIVDIKEKDVTFFENFQYINKNIEEITQYMQNVTYVDSTIVKMDNVSIFGVYGSFNLNIDNDIVKSSLFTTIELSSAEDTDSVFRKISKEYAQANKLKESEIFLYNNENKTEYKDSTSLYDKNNSLKTQYSKDNIVTNIFTQYDGTKYKIFMETSFS